MSCRTLLAACCLTLATLLHAQNPIISGQFTADPTARVFNGRVYLYPSHDIPSPIEKLKTWFCMADYHVFSSSNLVDWQDHGVIVSQERVPWVDGHSYTMWAPDCVEKSGKYYFYFPASPKGEEHGFGVGVAIANSPEGPFMPMWHPIKGIKGIDPCVLQSSDGHSYIYWAGNGLHAARLSDNMLELATEPIAIEGLPEGFKEGPFAFEHQGRYYLTFPWVRKPNGTETLAYAMSSNPLGPFTFQGIIMDESPTGCWTNHHSIVRYHDQWYLFYHHNDYSPSFDKNRSVRIDSLTFNPDGTIRKVVPTLRGVGISSALSRLQIDRYSTVSPHGVRIAYLDTANCFQGWKAIFSGKRNYLIYNKVSFDAHPVSTVTLRCRSRHGGTMTITTGSPQGPVVARAKIGKSSQWQLTTVPVPASPRGILDLCFSVKTSGEVEVDWVGFDALPWEKGAFETHRYRNLFAEMGHSQAEIDAKLHRIFHEVFEGQDKIYFEAGDSMAYISDIKNHDVRTEGMSYGMMIAVQFDRKDIFDRLWRWSKRYMQHQSGPREGYFAWSCQTDGTRNAEGPASDGELYYITSLIFASNRWGNDGDINYLREAQHILNCSMQKVGMNSVSPLINLHHRLITFTPDPYGGQFTDPSYHLPAFYEVWAKWAGDGRSDYWKDCALKSREFLHRCTHPQTGLSPDYCNYDGTLLGSRGIIGDAFRFDSWRVPMNIALDYSWACSDRLWQQQYADRIQNFLYRQGIDRYVDQYNTDGTAVTDTLQAGTSHKALRHSVGLVATAAAASLAATHAQSREFADRLWTLENKPYADGFFDAYYDGLLRLFAFMHLSGRYRIIEPRDHPQ